MENLVKLNKDERGKLEGLFSDAEEVWENRLYRVGLYREKSENEVIVIRLSIKSRDNKSHDNKPIEPSWRDKQEIKNHLVGAEFEGVELYPAESRLNDQVNQYHLWIIENRTFRFPFGWKGRATLDGDDVIAEIEEE